MCAKLCAPSCVGTEVVAPLTCNAVMCAALQRHPCIVGLSSDTKAQDNISQLNAVLQVMERASLRVIQCTPILRTEAANAAQQACTNALQAPDDTKAAFATYHQQPAYVSEAASEGGMKMTFIGIPDPLTSKPVADQRCKIKMVRRCTAVWQPAPSAMGWDAACSCQRFSTGQLP